MKLINHESGEPIWLIPDAYDMGVGAWVGQEPTSDTASLEALHSSKFSNAKMNYRTTNKETLAIVNALETYHYILSGAEFTMVKDHQCVTYLKTMRHPTQRQI